MASENVDRILAELAAEKARKLRRLVMLLSVSGFIVVTTTFLLMIAVNPPRVGAEVTGLQEVCVFVMFVGGISIDAGLILGIVGVTRRASRQLMWWPLAISIALLLLPGLIGLACWAMGLFT